MNPRLAVLLSSLYVAQGLPSGFFAHALPTLLRQHDVSLTMIGLAKLLALPWFFKFLWAPYVDRIGRQRNSHYRSWILAVQATGMLVLATIALLHPEHWFSSHLPAFLLAALLINTCLATQDIATDALAVKLLPTSQRGLGLAAWALVPLGWHSNTAIYSIAIFEQVTDAMSTVALFAGMMGFCRAGHEGSDYTVQMSLFMVVSGTLGLAGGALADALGAPLFFMAMGTLGFLCLGWVWRAMVISTPRPSDHPSR